MYKKFYGLLEDPFNISPDPKFLHLCQNHREGMSHLLYGIERKKSPIVLIGDIGTGKTTLLYSLIERIDKRAHARAHVAFLVNSQLNFTEILQHILYEFGLDMHNKSKGELLIDLKKFLKDCDESKEDVIVILDEAQNFSEGILEELRLLTNIETAREKLIQIILVGQLGLEEKLKLPELAQLRQRIGVSYRLLPISYHEVKDYIETRLTVAGATRPIFTPEAVEAIYTFSKGVPRVINVMCDLALFFGFTDKKTEIGRTIIGQVEESLNFHEPAEHTDYNSRRWRNNAGLDAVVIRQARADLTQKPSDQPTDQGGSEPLEKRAVDRGFVRLAYTTIAVCIVLLGLICGGLAWEQKDLTALITRWSHSLQQLLMLEQSPTLEQSPIQAIDPSPMHNIEMTLPLSANERSKNQGINNQITKIPGEFVANKVNDSAESIVQGPLSPDSKKDAVLEKRSSSNVREQPQDQKIVIVQHGDTLSKIIIREYGQYDRNTLDSVLKYNPDIVNISRIEVGRRITLPKLSKQTTNN